MGAVGEVSMVLMYPAYALMAEERMNERLRELAAEGWRVTHFSATSAAEDGGEVVTYWHFVLTRQEVG
jgi:hypothetical protein